jgi:hypothetical protein
MLKVFYSECRAKDKIIGFKILYFHRPVTFQKDIFGTISDLILGK